MFLRYLFLCGIASFSFVVSAQKLGDFIYSSQISQIESFSSQPGDLAYQVYQIHIQIAEHQLSGAMPLVQQDVIVLINTLKEFSDYSIIDAMQAKPNKSEILDSYISAMESALYSTNATQLQLQSEIKLISSTISLCTDEKATYEKLYLDALAQSIPTQNLDTIVQSVQQNSACIATNTSLLSSKQQLSDSLGSQSLIVGDRYDYLVSHRDSILTHFDLLRSDYLQTVLDIQSNIQNGNY